MRLVYALASTALLSLGCGPDFDRYEGGGDGSAPSDAMSSGDAPDAAPLDAARDTASGPDGADATGSEGSGMTGPDGAVCGMGMVNCGSNCISSCASCNGGTDYVTCLVCADGGAPVHVCAPADPNGFCLDGNYAHCPCQQDSDCPASNQRCTNNQCTACGEPLFNQNHTRCSTAGDCCKTGANLGKCSC